MEIDIGIAAKDRARSPKSDSKTIGVTIELRAGLHTGPVVGGVIGSTRMTYDY